MTNSTTDRVKSFTWPKRRVSQPVSGSEMAFATPNEVITQVPWSGDTPRSPEIAGIDTLAIDVSSTFMKVASDSAIVPSTSVEPVSGGSATGVPRGGTPAATGLSAFSPGTAVLPLRAAPQCRWRALPDRCAFASNCCSLCACALRARSGAD